MVVVIDDMSKLIVLHLCVCVCVCVCEAPPPPSQRVSAGSLTKYLASSTSPRRREKTSALRPRSLQCSASAYALSLNQTKATPLMPPDPPTPSTHDNTAPVFWSRQTPPPWYPMAIYLINTVPDLSCPIKVELVRPLATISGGVWLWAGLQGSCASGASRRRSRKLLRRSRQLLACHWVGHVIPACDFSEK